MKLRAWRSQEELQAKARERGGASDAPLLDPNELSACSCSWGGVEVEAGVGEGLREVRVLL